MGIEISTNTGAWAVSNALYVQASRTHDCSVDGAIISPPTESLYDGQSFTIKIISGYVAPPSLSTGFAFPADATSPLPFSSGVGLYDYLKVVRNDSEGCWDILSFINGYSGII